MATLVQLIRGEGRADTVVRSVLFTLILAMSLALVWVTLAEPLGPTPSQPLPHSTTTSP